ncbi:hypothetical protein ASPCAL05742 [Aspergillus calidoustus]|uniref:Uncharacterized protein n=1 Tax=Aspergillus calidoustus TaxID=454130 RepID=A0A0U5FZ38_ASPCI|nr:hypothetical protein ASPCAL05742 [Aspergillus calidoustus]
MSYNSNSRDASRRRKSNRSMELLDQIEEEWNESQSNSPTVNTPRSTQPSSPASPHISTPTSTRVMTPASATASPTYPRSVPNPPRRSVTSAPMHETQSPAQGQASGENSDFEVPPLRVRPKLTRINTSPDIAGHTPVEDPGHSVSLHPSDTHGKSYTNTPVSSYNTYNDTGYSDAYTPSPARGASYTYTPTYSPPRDLSPDSPSDFRYIPTPVNDTLSDISQNDQPTGIANDSDLTTDSDDTPPRSPRWRDGREVPEERLEHDFDRETPQVVLDAEEAANNTREGSEGTLTEMLNLTRLATMMELFFTAENALTAEDEDRAEWKIRDGLTIAQELGETEYIQRAEIMLKAVADLGRQKVQEAYERAHRVTYVADGDESESESESEGDSDSDGGDDDDDDDQNGSDGENLADILEGRPEDFGLSDGDADSEVEGHHRASREAADFPLFQEAGRFLHPQSSSRGKTSRSPPTSERKDRYRHPADNGDQSGAFPTDTPEKSQKQKKRRSRNRGPRHQYVKPRNIVLPATFQSWEANSEGEEQDPLSRHFIMRKRRREEYSETRIWSHLLRLKPVSAARSKLPMLRKRVLRLLPQTWYTPDSNGDTDQPPPPGGFLAVHWWTHGLSLLLQMMAPVDNEWQAKYESSAFKPGRAEFTFRAHIPCSWMATASRCRSTDLFPEQPCEYLADEEEVGKWKKDFAEAKLDMPFLYWERAQFQNAIQLKKEGRLAPRQKKAKTQQSRFPVIDFSLISWVKLFIMLFFLYWFCFGFWKAGILTRIHIPVWNPFAVVDLSRLGRLEDYLPERLRLG